MLGGRGQKEGILGESETGVVRGVGDWEERIGDGVGRSRKRKKDGQGSGTEGTRCPFLGERVVGLIAGPQSGESSPPCRDERGRVGLDSSASSVVRAESRLGSG